MVPCCVLEAVVTDAVIVTVPAWTPVTAPVLVTVAVLVLPELHATWLVMSFWLLSAKVAVALSWMVDPADTVVVVVEVTSILCKAEVLTITPALAETPSCDAVMVVVPAATAVTRPALTEATPAEELLQVAVLVASWLSPLTVVPLAVICFVSPTAKKSEVGVRLMLFREFPETKKSPHPLPNRTTMRATGSTAVQLSFPLTAPIFRIMREFYQKRLL